MFILQVPYHTITQKRAKVRVKSRLQEHDKNNDDSSLFRVEHHLNFLSLPTSIPWHANNQKKGFRIELTSIACRILLIEQPPANKKHLFVTSSKHLSLHIYIILYYHKVVVTLWLMCSSLEQVVRVQALAGDTVLCSWARHLTLTVPLSTQEYTDKWVSANCLGNLTNCGEWSAMD